ncbi:hypothetical protein [Tahibacter amnicola]|uniref:FAR1 domain-containing protein n=1 Tax=Tahibacter amnicola TaxID=2976241 RepID=A0ABY6BEJ9_9GAMM|nr:hypothetical protein [Tahibacter amnicola]UXI66775.1 hypothetical protein N4264_18750 [Tahibacter amnicola]
METTEFPEIDPCCSGMRIHRGYACKKGFSVELNDCDEDRHYRMVFRYRHDHSHPLVVEALKDLEKKPCLRFESRMRIRHCPWCGAHLSRHIHRQYMKKTGRLAWPKTIGVSYT